MAEPDDESKGGAKYPRHRLDALADGIYGVAMTLLVLDVRLPAGMTFKTDGELIAQLVALGPKFGPYVLSFWVLSGRWRALVQGRTSHAAVGRDYVTWSLLHLFLVTMMPFSTLLIGGSGSRAPAIWIYTANLVGLSVTAWLAGRGAPPDERKAVGDNTVGMAVLLAASAVVVVASLADTAWATLGFLLLALTPTVERVAKRWRARNA